MINPCPLFYQSTSLSQMTSSLRTYNVSQVQKWMLFRKRWVLITLKCCTAETPLWTTWSKLGALPTRRLAVLIAENSFSTLNSVFLLSHLSGTANLQTVARMCPIYNLQSFLRSASLKNSWLCRFSKRAGPSSMIQLHMFNEEIED